MAVPVGVVTDVLAHVKQIALTIATPLAKADAVVAARAVV